MLMWDTKEYKFNRTINPGDNVLRRNEIMLNNFNIFFVEILDFDKI